MVGRGHGSCCGARLLALEGIGESFDGTTIRVPHSFRPSSYRQKALGSMGRPERVVKSKPFQIVLLLRTAGAMQRRRSQSRRRPLTLVGPVPGWTLLDAGLQSARLLALTRSVGYRFADLEAARGSGVAP